jgi:hypothetical protein
VWGLVALALGLMLGVAGNIVSAFA